MEKNKKLKRIAGGPFAGDYYYRDILDFLGKEKAYLFFNFMHGQTVGIDPRNQKTVVFYADAVRFFGGRKPLFI